MAAALPSRLAGLRRTDRVLLAAIAFAYLATRLALIGRFPAFWDESFHAVQSQTTLDHPGAAWDMLLDNKGPLLNWLSTPLIGLGLGPLAAVRAVSLAAGAVTLSMVGLIGRRLGGPTTGWVAAGVYVVLPFCFVHDVLGLLDPLLTATAMASLYLQLKLADRPTTGRAIALGLVMGAGTITRQIGFTALVLLPASLLLVERGPGRRERVIRWARFAAGAAVLALLVNALLRLSPNHGDIAANRAALDQYRSLDEVVREPFGVLSTNWPSFGPALSGYLTVPLILLLAPGIGLALRRSARLTGVLLIWSAAPLVAALLLVPFGYPRYILSAIPPLAVLIGFAVSDGLREIRTRWADTPGAARAVAAVGALLFVPAAAFDLRVLAHPSTARYPGEDDWQFVAGWPAGTGLDGIARALETRAPAGATKVAAVYYTPWNLAVKFDDPHRLRVTRQPSQDEVVANGRGKTFHFVNFGSPGAETARFVLDYSGFALPEGRSLIGYRLVASFTRPRGGEIQGRQQPRTTVRLFERR
jgi:4-amino-4-deoxy-L-arabinose transferase-like glycosyltransferase